MSKLLNKLSKQKTETNKHLSQVWLEPTTYAALKKAVKEDGLSIQKVLQTSVEVYLEERKSK